MTFILMPLDPVDGLFPLPPWPIRSRPLVPWRSSSSARLTLCSSRSSVLRRAESMPSAEPAFDLSSHCFGSRISSASVAKRVSVNFSVPRSRTREARVEAKRVLERTGAVEGIYVIATIESGLRRTRR